jgi:putative lipoic acid-binding regulatory protein
MHGRVDTTTGKVINEFGATRFDVAVQAMRGAFDPPPWADNTERAAGTLLDSLVQFPAIYPFQVVLKQGASSSSDRSSHQQQAPDQLLERYRSIIAQACAADVSLEQCSVKERLGGKYVSLTIPARVPAAEVVHLVLDSLKDDPMVVMRF